MSKVVAMVREEVRKALPPAIFFLVLFHLVALTNAVSLKNYGFTSLRAVSATLAALIVAKAILVVEALPISQMFPDRIPIQILWKTILYGLVVLLFKGLEEAIHVIPRHESVAAGIQAMVQAISWPVFAVVTLWIFWGLVLYCVTAELARAAGPRKARNILLGAKNGGG